MNKRQHTIRFIVADWLAAFLAWGMFFIYRKQFIEYHEFNFKMIFDDNKFVWGIIVIPICWVAAYALVGTYQNVFRKIVLANYTILEMELQGLNGTQK